MTRWWFKPLDENFLYNFPRDVRLQPLCNRRLHRRNRRLCTVETSKQRSDFRANRTWTGTCFFFRFVHLASTTQSICMSLIVRQRKAEVIIPNVWNIQCLIRFRSSSTETRNSVSRVYQTRVCTCVDVISGYFSIHTQVYMRVLTYPYCVSYDFWCTGCSSNSSINGQWFYMQKRIKRKI